MSETITVETTCDKCGRDIEQFDSRWVVTLDERHDPNASGEEWLQQDQELHVCIECVDEVLGDLIRNAGIRT